MKRLALFFWLIACPAPAHDAATHLYDPETVWKLIEIDGKPFHDRALIAFPQVGRIQGQAPCNRFSGALWSSYPWFKPENLAATRMACPALKAETRFFEALDSMSLAEISDDTLILFGDDGQTMRFTRQRPSE